CAEERAAAGTTKACSPVTLGLDLQGGMHLVLEVEDSEGTMTPESRADATDRALRIIRSRIAQFGVEEPLIQKVGDDYGRRHSFNTAIAALMELLNHVSRFDDMSDAGRALRHEALEAMVLLLNPVTPHVSHALWQALGHAETLIEDVPFPQADPAALVRDALTLAVQVNGKLRGTIEVPVNVDKAEAERLALAEPHVARFIGEQPVHKVIVVPGKIVNIVIAG
ncbi:MAG: class I tRNA ligase family protein, partial [Proteobacteria bacterium]|nr:class I tRNA ligase family protein [Pseudomonadota bacterium]